MQGRIQADRRGGNFSSKFVHGHSVCWSVVASTVFVPVDSAVAARLFNGELVFGSAVSWSKSSVDQKSSRPEVQ